MRIVGLPPSDPPPRRQGQSGWDQRPSPARQANRGSRWRNLRDQALRRDHGICYLCGQPGADAADHIIPTSQGGSDELDNLGSVHDRVAPWCHRSKTNQESQQALARQRARGRHPVEPHPGLPT